MFTQQKRNCRIAPITTTVLVSGASLVMEVDTGASASIISENTYRNSWTTEQAPRLRPTTNHLCTYTKEALEVKGVITVLVEYEKLIVVGGDGPSLLRRDWLHKIKLDWP